MPPQATRTPAETFAGILADLCRAIAAAAVKNPLAAPLLLLLWPRLNRLARRFAGLAARVASGTAARRRSAAPRPAAQRSRQPYRRLPRRFAWLPPLVPGAAAYGSQLQHLLTTPEMADILAAAPQAGRLLRPLCRMLGVRPPPALAPALAPPPRPARPRQPPSSRPAAVGPSATAPPADPPRAAPLRPPNACGPPVAA